MAKYLTDVPTADFDGDGDVDGDDFLIWQAGFGVDDSGDADRDGDTDGDDFLIWQNKFPSPGIGSLSATTVPEPVSIALLLGLAAIGTLSRRVRIG